MRTALPFLRGLALCTVFSATGLAQEADDATRAAARTLGYAGVEAYQAGDFDAASEKLEKAYQVLQVPSLGLWSARALEKRGRWVEAAERYRQIARLDVGGGELAVQEKAKADASAELAALEPRLPKLVILLEGAEPSAVRLSIDGKAIPPALVGVEVPVNPGAHRIEGIRGTDEVASDLTLREASTERVTLRFQEVAEEKAALAPTPPPVPADPGADEPPPAGGSFVTETLPWILVGAGAAAGIGGAVTYFVAAEDDETIVRECPNRECDGEHQGLVDRFMLLRVVYPVLWISGGAMAAAGGAIFVFRPADDGAEVSLAVTPGAVFATGRF